MKCAHELERNCDLYPKDIAVRIMYPENETAAIEEISWESLNKRCNQLANLLLSRNISANDPVKIAVNSWENKLIILLGALKIDAQIVLAENKAKQSDDAEFKAIFWESAHKKIFFASAVRPEQTELAKLLCFMSIRNPQITPQDKVNSEISADYSKDQQLSTVIISAGKTDEGNLELIMEAVRQRKTMLLWHN